MINIPYLSEPNQEMFPVIGMLTKLSIREASRWLLYTYLPVYAMENSEAMGLERLVHKNFKSVSNLKA